MATSLILTLNHQYHSNHLPWFRSPVFMISLPFLEDSEVISILTSTSSSHSQWPSLLSRWCHHIWFMLPSNSSKCKCNRPCSNNKWPLLSTLLKPMVRTPNLPTREDMRRRTKPRAKSQARKEIKLVRRDTRRSKRSQRSQRSPRRPRRPENPKTQRLLNQLHQRSLRTVPPNE